MDLWRLWREGGASAPVAPPLPTGLTGWIKTLIINRTRGDSHQGGKRRGLGPRNDVLTTCKAVTQRGGQRIFTVFFPQQEACLISSAGSLLASKIEKNHIMHLCFSCISYLSFGTEIARKTKTQPC